MRDPRSNNKTTRGNASQFYVAGELCRRGYAAVVTMGNTPNTDVLCSNIEGTKFVHIQVKTFVPGNATCSIGRKAEIGFGANFFWVIAGIPHPDSSDFLYYIIPSIIIAENTKKMHEKWLRTPGKKSQAHNDNAVRVVHIPPHKSEYSWDISEYKNRWDLIESKLYVEKAINLEK